MDGQMDGLKDRRIEYFIIPAFFFRKKGYINFVSKSVRRPSVCPSRFL